MIEERRSRRPPAGATLVLPVWGQSYVQDFLRYSLPTLLAPGNLASVAEALPSKVVILTSADDTFAFEENKLFGTLIATCDTEIRPIDHLITDGNHSTTITLAMTEAVLATGPRMLDTCFFFLVSDYILADGSLRNALRRIEEGASGVLVGNFQVTRESALPWLRRKLGSASGVLRLEPRETVRWALQHLHPATIANIMNVGLNHNSHTNRLFWRVNAGTLLGRFYLRHPLCIRPETTEFKVGSSADYSFVPEMCPSGNVVAITDSDEYLAVEMQPEHHEGQMLRLGPLTPKRLASSLSEWTTKEHRSNVRDSHLFHGGDLPAQLGEVVREADAFIADTERQLRGRPKPHRGHRYWQGALAAFFAIRPSPLGDPLAGHVYGTEALQALSGWRWRFRYFLLGRPPRLLPWAPDWPDFRIVLREIDAAIARRDEHLLFVASRPSIYSIWSSDRSERVHSIRSAVLAADRPASLASLRGRVCLCVLQLERSDLRKGRRLVENLVPLLTPGGRLVVTAAFEHGTAHYLTDLVPQDLELTGSHFVTTRRVRRLAQSGMGFIFRLVRSQPWFGIPMAVAAGIPVGALSAAANIDAVRRSTRAPQGALTSFSMVLVKPGVLMEEEAEGDV